MDNSPSSSSSGFSLRNVLVIVAPLALIALGLQWYLTHKAETDLPQSQLATFLQLNLVAPTKLDAGLVDDDGDLIADAPKDAAKLIDPDTLVFSVLGQDIDKEAPIYADFTKHLAAATGKKVELDIPDSVDAQMSDMREGKVHVAALATGSVSTAVNKGGFVPFCVMADANDKFGYEMKIIVPAASAIKTPADLKGQSFGFASPYSHSGFKAPMVILWKEFNLSPGHDYQPAHAGNQEMVAKGVAQSVFGAGAVPSDLLSRMIASGEVDEKAIRSIYSSSNFPTACFGYVHQLKPELADKVKKAFFDFPWEGTSLAKAYAAAGQTKFTPVSYKTAWAPVREMDEQARKLAESERARAKN